MPPPTMISGSAPENLDSLGVYLTPFISDFEAPIDINILKRLSVKYEGAQPPTFKLGAQSPGPSASPPPPLFCHCNDQITASVEC